MHNIAYKDDNIILLTTRRRLVQHEVCVHKSFHCRVIRHVYITVHLLKHLYLAKPRLHLHYIHWVAL
jgi:hypothetical protein